MIEHIRGSIDALSPATAVVEAAGVGYELHISLNTYSAIQGKETVKLYAEEDIREDAHLLFGFATRDERELFRLLRSVSGVGGQTARMILSAFTPKDLVTVIQTEDVRALKSVKGIGPKAAQRIIVDLKDKALKMQGSTPVAATGGHPEVVKEAVDALQVLGFPPAPAQKVVLQIVADNAGLGVEGIIKLALKML